MTLVPKCKTSAALLVWYAFQIFQTWAMLWESCTVEWELHFDEYPLVFGWIQNVLTDPSFSMDPVDICKLENCTFKP